MISYRTEKLGNWEEVKEVARKKVRQRQMVILLIIPVVCK